MTGAPPHIHWKTGTSFGHRDAWAAGSGPRYTAVVWLGNFDNTPSVRLVGADAAGPILFDVLDAVGRRGETVDEHPPSDLVRVEVCAYSGRLPGPGCDDKKWVHAIAKNVPVERCPYHVALDVDVQSGLALTPACRAGRDYRTENFVVWPASLRRWLDDQHRRAPEPPAFAPGCETRVAKGGPVDRVTACESRGAPDPRPRRAQTRDPPRRRGGRGRRAPLVVRRRRISRHDEARRSPVVDAGAGDPRDRRHRRHRPERTPKARRSHALVTLRGRHGARVRPWPRPLSRLKFPGRSGPLLRARRLRRGAVEAGRGLREHEVELEPAVRSEVDPLHQPALGARGDDHQPHGPPRGSA
jgi:membrane peptidoglycan carboxypeptidase